MKTKELIKALQEEDPSGELEVCVGNIPIYFAARLPAYYDGKLQMLIHDDSLRPYYSIVGYKVTGRGEKVNLSCMDLGDCLIDNPELPVDLSELQPHQAEEWAESVERQRAEYRNIISDVNEWAKEHGHRVRTIDPADPNATKLPNPTLGSRLRRWLGWE